MNKSWYKEFLKTEQKEIDIMKKYGMSDENIQAIVDRDYKAFCIDKKEKKHMSSLHGLDDMESVEGAMLYEKFPKTTTTEQNRNDINSGTFWMEEIENVELYKKLKKLSPKELRILTLFAMEDYSIKEIAKEENTSPSVICRMIKKIKSRLS